MEIATAIKDFLAYCEFERRLSENTIQAYRCDLADFSGWLAVHALTATIGTETLKAYLHIMVAERRLSAATVRRRIACLRAFFRRWAELDLIPDPFAGWRLALPRRRHLPRALSRTEVKSLLAQGAADPAHSSRRASLEGELGTAIRLMIATGMRIGELCKLRVEDIAPDAASIRVHGKGARDRVAYITDLACRTELQAMVNDRRRTAGLAASLFVNRLGARLKPQSVRLKLRRAAEAVGLTRRVTPHMLRHTAATLLIESGVDIRIVQRLLGHSSIATTEIYTHVSDETLRATLERANVLQTLATS